MFQSKFNRLIVASIAAAAIAPTAALASPASDAGGTASQTQDLRAPDNQPDNQVGGGAPGTGVVQDLPAPDQVAPGTQPAPVVAGPPTWPANPQTIKPAPANATSDNGIDDGVLIALGGGALLLVAGIGVAGRKRLQVVRQRQLA
jgi:hypothetical protein